MPKAVTQFKPLSQYFTCRIIILEECSGFLGPEDTLVADRGYFYSEENLACEESGITITLPKPMTSGAKAEGRFGKQDFVYVAKDDVYLCPAGERLTYRYRNEEEGKTLRRYWTTACLTCGLKPKCTTGISRWQHEHGL